MNVMNWLFVFITSLLGMGTIGYLFSRSSRRRHGLWNMLSLAFASVICATMFATLFVYSPTVTSAVQAAAAQSFTCVGTPALVRAGDAIAITGVAEAGSEVTVLQGKTTLATATADNAGAFAATITLTAPGLQNVTCQSATNAVTLSFLVIGQAAPAPTATNTPEPTATNTPKPTATATPAPTATDTAAPAAAPEIDMASIPEQILPGDTFRLRGTAAGGARVRVTINDKVVAGAVTGPSGNWRATVGFAKAGTYTVTAQLIENDAIAAESAPVFIEVIEPTPEPTATDTPAPTATNTPEPTATDTPEPTATDTPEPTATNTPEPTATNTPEPTATNTPEPTATDTPEPTATNTPEPTATNTPEPTATNTPEPTAAAPVIDVASIPEQILPGDTFRLRGTADGGARVRVTINNRVVAGAVTGPSGSWRATVGFANAGIYTVTAQLVENDAVAAESEPILVEVIAPTPEPTATNTPEPTATNTPEPTATNTPEPTATNTPEPTATNTPEPTATNTPEPTATNTPEPTATNTPEPTATNTPEPTATNTPEPTATNTPEPTATNTPEPTATDTPEPTATNTPLPTATNTPEPTATNTPEPTATNTPEPVAPVVDTASIPEQILPGETFRLRGTAASGAKVHVSVNNKVMASAVAGPNGNWRTTIGFAAAGTYTVTAQLVENDTVTAQSEPILVEVIAPTPTNTPEATPTTTPEPTATSAAAVDASQAVSETTAVDASQPVSDTVAAPEALPGTGSDFSQGVPWVILLLVVGALLTLGIGRLSHKLTA